MNKQSGPTQIITVVFLSTVFVLAIYALGFFTNLIQIRGAYREIYNLYQSYVRMVFNFSLWGIALVVVRIGVLSQLTKKNTILQFALGVIIALGVIVISVYSLLRMGELQTLYRSIDIENVRVLYPKYEYDDSIFMIGYFVNSATLIASIVFLIMVSMQTSWKRKEAAK